MIKKHHHYSLWIALLLVSCLSFANAKESNQENNENSDSDDKEQMQMTDTTLDGGSIMGSLMNMPDTKLDTSKINAVQQQNQINQQQKDAQVEAIVRREQKDPKLKKQRERGSNKNATGMITPTGRERDLENLTDAERVMSNEYVHDGRTQRIYREECGEDNRALCEGRKNPNGKSLIGLDDATMEMMAKAYSMTVGFAGGDFKKADKTGSEKTGKNQKGPKNSDGDSSSSAKKGEEDDTVSDYCKYIPMGVEGLAMFQQMSAQEDIKKMSSSSGSRQRDTLLQAAESHEERAKQAKIQATGWTASLACYSVYAALPSVSFDWKLGVKLAGSALFSAHYWDSVGRHEDDAEEVRKIAHKLPSKGDCNPVTDRLCYCTEESTRNDPDFCMPEIRNRYVDKMAEFTTPCLDNKGKTDVECQCRDTNSCFDRKIEDGLRGVGFSTSDLKGIRPVQELSRGSLSSSGLNQAQRANSAIRDRVRKKLGRKISKLANSKKLTPKQQSDADALAKKGFPKPMAEILSAAPMNSEAQKKLAEMKKENIGPKNYNANTKGHRPKESSIRATGGAGLNPGSRAEEDSGNEFSDMMKKLNGEEGREMASGQVLRFAERAQNAAQISKREDTFLFDIISHRYQKTAWKRFDVDFDARPAVNE